MKKTSWEAPQGATCLVLVSFLEVGKSIFFNISNTVRNVEKY